MDIRDYLRVILKRKWIIIAITLGVTIVSAVVSKFVLKKQYSADIAVIISSQDQQWDRTKSGQSYNDLMMYQKMVKTYSEFAKSRMVLDDVIEKVKLNINVESLKGMITVNPKSDTEFLTITVKSESPQQAKDIANQIALSLKDKAKDVMKVDNIQILDEALFPKHPSSPKVMLNTAIAFALGLMVSVGLAFLLEFLDNTVKTEEDIMEVIGLPVIGIIPVIEE